MSSEDHEGELKSVMSVIGAFATLIVIVAVILVASGSPEPGVHSTASDSTHSTIAPIGSVNIDQPAVVETKPAEPAKPAPVAPAVEKKAAAVVAKAAPAVVAAPAAANSEATYKMACAMCHATGAAGAPKVGDKAAWGPRIAQGMETLVQHAVKGFAGSTGVMPAKGGSAHIPDDEIAGIVEYMVNNSQ